MVRARKEYDEKRGKAADRLLLFPSTRPRRASMETQSEPEPPSADTSRDIGSPAKSTRSAPADGQHDEAGDLEGEIHEMTWEGEDGKWTEADWQKWREMESKDKPQAPDPDDLPWDELEVDTMEVLPDEVLGWLLLRRAGLPASSRLSVQAAIGNSLRFTEVERALRDQEEELLQAETRASERRGPQKRSYWVEQEQEWGLLDMHPDSSDETPVHWIGKELPAEVYALSAAGSAGELDAEPGGDAWWSSTATWDEPTWWSSPTWWTEEWSEPELTSEEQKQVDEAYAAYEDKVRTFVQARTLMKDKTRNRGFYQAAKGKGKASKGKGKGKGPTPTLAAASPTFMAVKGSKGKAKGPNYTCCFICGSRDHGYQSCPQRTRGPGKGCPSSSGQAMVVISGWEVPDLPEEDYEDGHGYESYTDEVETVHAEAWTVQEAGHRCYAVLDSGATETVTSLTALTEIMNYRKELFGDEDVKVYPADGKSFRFGNGRTMLASSFVEIPQFLNGQKVWLGAYTLDTEDAFVPMLIGMRTLQKLEAVVDFRSRLAIFPTLSPDMITLHQCPRTGHLMIDLSADWARTSAYMALPADSGVQEGPVEFEPAQVATDGHVGVAGQMDEDARAPAARIKRLLASRPSENPESNGHGPGQQADQQGRSERPAGNFVIMQYFGQQEGEGQGEEGEQVERGSDLRHGPEGGVGRVGQGPEVEEEEVEATQASTRSLISESLENMLSEMRECMQELGSCFCGGAHFGAPADPGSNRQMDLLEVCCAPDSLLASMVNVMGGAAGRVTEANMNINTTAGLEEAKRCVRTEKPRWLWISFPCGATSPLQRLNELTPEGFYRSQQRKKKSRRLVRRGLELIRIHVFENGGQFGWEWPKENEAWEWKEVKDFLKEAHEKVGIYKTLLHGCRVGVQDGVGNPLKKPWTIYTTSRTMASSLNLECTGGHTHGKCEGGSVPKRTGFYTQPMVRIIAREVMRQQDAMWFECYHAEELVAPVTDNPKQETPVEEIPEGLSVQQWQRIKDVVYRLHVRAGHPSVRALVASLKSRGSHPTIVEAARQLRCDDCDETKRSTPASKASFHRADTLWHTLQVDNAVFRVGTRTYHIMVMVDEASTFMVPHFLAVTEEDEHENATGGQVVNALQESWIRFFGYPSVIRLDPEGAFRSRVLEDYCASRDIELEPCAAEAHHQIGVVERSIGTLRKSVERYLRAEASEPWAAIMAMCAAHNEMARVGGFSPCQWALGRSPGLDEKMHTSGRDGTSLHAAQRDPHEEVSRNLAVRLKAEEMYRKQMAQDAINRAWNSQSRKKEVLAPGTMVYYKRYKPPTTSTASHKEVDVSRRNIARWYGPARILATETRIYSGTGRPGHIIWITAAGRLKRVAPEQIRLASEREKILAEVSGPGMFPWTIHGMLENVETGQFDTYNDILGSDKAEITAKRTRSLTTQVRHERMQPPQSRISRGRSRSHERVGVGKEREKTPSRAESRPGKEQRTEEIGQPRAPVSKAGRAQLAPETAGARSAQRSVPASSSVSPLNPSPKGSRASRPVPSHGADTGELASNKQFQDARKRHEALEKPLHVASRKGASSFLVDEPGMPSGGDIMFCLHVDLPDNAKDEKMFKRDPASWVAKKVKKSAEVKLENLTESQRADFKKAKDLEVSQWIQAAACRALEDGKVAPRSRTMKMRWVLTFKHSGAAKARIVIVGFTDPDLDTLQRASPTMTRRTRQLMMTMAAVTGWQQWKGDAKSAFLQTSENTEESRSVFAVPVDELADAMGVERKRAVQVIKSCYGLVNAPFQWFQEIKATIIRLGGEVLKTEPCCWRIRCPTTNKVVGLIASHVDDFYMIGDQADAAWTDFLYRFRCAYRWSPWECDSFEHCGVLLQQDASQEVTLDHSTFCTSVNPIELDSKEMNRPISAGERDQLRAVLGAVQWRAQQSGPQHCAKLGQLQSRVSTADVQTLLDANKLVREVYAQRFVAPAARNLGCDPEEVEFACWSDAALANRPDGGSTGGFVVCATSPALRLGQRAKLNFISWRSMKLRRVARSSLSAEVQAFGEGEEELMFCRLEWAEMIGHEIDLRSPEATCSKVVGIMITDAKSLYDVVQKGQANTSGLGLTEKYASLELLSVIERLTMSKVITRWVDSAAQLADSLTKHMVSSALHQVLQTGTWTLVHDPHFVSAKKKKAAARADATYICGKSLWGM